ncbi:MAG: hypothetical protein IKQ44_12405 [Lachnospiraceae bacterium]|nr:hypothetical protein [Lachnospiraceae bacterium]
MMKRERKQVTTHKVSKIFIKTLLLIMMAMTVGMFAPIGARADEYTIDSNTSTSQLKTDHPGIGPNDSLIIKGTVMLTVDEPLTIKYINEDTISSDLTITGNAGLTVNAGANNAIVATDLKIINCSINATNSSNATIAATNNILIDNSNVTANGQNAGIMSVNGGISITNNSVVNVSGSQGIYVGGNLSISGAGTQVIIYSTYFAMGGLQGISLNDGLEITEPAGGVKGPDSGVSYIYESDGTTRAKKVTIKNPNYVPPTVNNPNSEQKVSSNTSSHTHSFSWVVTKSPTSTSDGEEAYMCSCGEIERTSILPAISAFEEETINKIKNAPANAVIEVETSLFNSFGIGVRDALAARPDVTLKVKFLSEGYRGQLLKVTIPTGIDRYALWDEKGWLGLCRAGSTLGYDK